MAQQRGRVPSIPEPVQPNAAYCVVLHDVAPETWHHYTDFIAALDALGNIPVTLLVVPDFHRHGRLDLFPHFITAIEQRLAKGDEVVLHGYYHDDPTLCSFSPKEWLLRRVYTHEGEFYRLTEAQARCRLTWGVELFARLGWPLHGFVSPAWLLGEGARRALGQFPFIYTSTARGLERLAPPPALIPAPCLVWSARSAWRRTLSRAWNNRCFHRHRNAPLIRLGIHPIDMLHPSVRSYWLRLVEHLSLQRQPMTKIEWLEARGEVSIRRTAYPGAGSGDNHSSAARRWPNI